MKAYLQTIMFIAYVCGWFLYVQGMIWEGLWNPFDEALYIYLLH
jgi:hypothetical protein